MQLKQVRFFLTTFLVAALSNSITTCAMAAEQKIIRPNIVFILADDMARGDLGIYGGTQAPTPNIDKLAQEGLRFNQFYTSAPICSASRAGFFTGMYPGRWRINSFLNSKAGNKASEQADYLDPRAPSLARFMKSAGYATAHFGKWHLGGGRDVTDAPKFAAYGFDESAGTWESPEPHADITAKDWIFSPEDKVKRWDRTAFFVDKALNFIERHKDQPIFVQMWFDDVHTPWIPDEQSDKKPTPENFIPVLKVMDAQVGRFIKGLQALGLDENTLVIFSSDNGALPTFDGARSGGFRGSKLSLYEGGTRMPFIVRWPQKVPVAVNDKTIFSAVDLLPTLTSIAGIDLPKDLKLDGQDLSAAFFGRTASHKGPLFWEYGRNQITYKYPSAPDRSPTIAVRENDWKLLVNANGEGLELYNLAKDPTESTNLAEKEPHIANRLRVAALNWRKSLP